MYWRQPQRKLDIKGHTAEVIKEYPAYLPARNSPQGCTIRQVINQLQRGGDPVKSPGPSVHCSPLVQVVSLGSSYALKMRDVLGLVTSVIFLGSGLVIFICTCDSGPKQLKAPCLMGSKNWELRSRTKPRAPSTRSSFSRL